MDGHHLHRAFGGGFADGVVFGEIEELLEVLTAGLIEALGGAGEFSGAALAELVEF